jgi:hypothetical protein
MVNEEEMNVAFWVGLVCIPALPVDERFGWLVPATRLAIIELNFVTTCRARTHSRAVKWQSRRTCSGQVLSAATVSCEFHAIIIHIPDERASARPI